MRSADRVIAAFIREHVAPHSRVIDVGCGSGWATLVLTGRKLKCETECVDSDALAVTYANSALRRRGRTARCQRCAAEELRDRFGARRFDAGVAVHALHHFDRPVQALRQMRTVLNREGRLFLSEFSSRYGETRDDCPRYSLDKIKALVKRAGFRQVSGFEQPPGVLLVQARR